MSALTASSINAETGKVDLVIRHFAELTQCFLADSCGRHLQTEESLTESHILPCVGFSLGFLLFPSKVAGAADL